MTLRPPPVSGGGRSPEGLTQAEAARRLGEVGPNELARVRGASWLGKLVAPFTHLMALLLWVGGGVALAARLPQLAVAIWAVNLINGLFSLWQEHRAERSAEALRRLLPRRARVMRDGQEVVLPAEELVPGDLLLLAEGDQVSADGLLVWEAGLRVDESVLTGESRPVRKDPGTPVFAGSSVAQGRARAEVTGTGMRTRFGEIARLTSAIPVDPSPLQQEIERVTRTVTALAVGVGLACFPLAVGLVGMTVPEGFLFALGMIVAFVPEGLLPTVTLALALGVQRMARRQALVKRLSAVETLGCTNVICTDKTGTLTQNEMTVREIWCGGRTLRVTGSGYGSGGEVEGADSEPVRDLLCAAALCNDARLAEGGRALGDPTELALLVLARKGGWDGAGWRRVAEVPFDPARKRMSTVCLGEGGLRVLVKGSARELAGLCPDLSGEGRRALAAEEDRMASEGLRVLGFAERRLGALPADLEPGSIERGLRFLGLAGIWDPPRPEVAEAVARCRTAGIRILMITGDYGLTGESIARRIGILRSGRARIVTGPDLQALDDAGLQAVLDEEDVLFARVSPDHKLRVVQALQERGLVVAVTGDGVNDAPALRKADIGVAMGRSGSDVAREAADMVLADDSFASIVDAVEEGRAVYANLRRFVSYIFTSNAPEAVPFFAYAFSGGRIPLALNLMQVLSIDLGTDMVPALALGCEPAEAGVMGRPPRNRREPLITPELLRRSYLWLGSVQALAAMCSFYFVYWLAGYRALVDLPSSGPLYGAATTLALAAVVFTQIGNLQVHRSAGGRNPMIPLGVGVELLFLLALVYLPFGRLWFGTEPVPWQGWLFVSLWIPALPLADAVRRWCRCAMS